MRYRAAGRPVTSLGRNRTGRATLGILRIVAAESALTPAGALLYSRKDRFGCPRATVWTGGEGPEDDGAEAWSGHRHDERAATEPKLLGQNTMEPGTQRGRMQRGGGQLCQGSGRQRHLRGRPTIPARGKLCPFDQEGDGKKV